MGVIIELEGKIAFWPKEFKDAEEAIWGPRPPKFDIEFDEGMAAGFPKHTMID